MIKAVTFDLWDTVLLDDSDEPKRAAQGLPPKREARRQLVHEALERQRMSDGTSGGSIDRRRVDLAYDTTDAAFHRVWYGQNVTWTVRERLSVLLEGLGRQLPDDEFAELVRRHEEMELEIKPDLLPHVQKALESLRGRYKLGVISDAIFSPGRVLREILKSYGLYDSFDHLVFSDEAGCSKPAAGMFAAAARGLGVDVDEIVHIGDREPKDVAGARSLGARAILVRIAGDRQPHETEAEAVCDDYRELRNVLGQIER